MYWLVGCCLIVLLSFGPSFAALPLITDDTGTQGKGKVQFEFSFEQEHEHGEGVTEDESRFRSAITYGIVDHVDLILAVPYFYVRTEDHGIRVKNSGLADITLETKWRFFECNGLSLAIKPGLSFPSGNKADGLGAGEVGGSTFFIITKEVDPLAFHLNIGYIRNENDVEEGKNVWHISVATVWRALTWMEFVADVGAEGGRDPEKDLPEAFILGGTIFHVKENLDLDIGLKGNFAEAADGFTLLTGVTYRF